MTNPTPDAEPLCKFEQGCHRVVACEPGCAAATVPASAPTDPMPGERAAALLAPLEAKARALRTQKDAEHRAAVLREAFAAISADAALRETEGEYGLAEYGRELARLVEGLADGAPVSGDGTTADKAYALGLTDTEYRARSHAAAVAAVRAAIPGMYAHVGHRLEDVLNEGGEAQQDETQAAPGTCGHRSSEGHPCTQPSGHLGYHRNSRQDGNEWTSWVGDTPASDAEECCGAEPPEGWPGDCWCTLPPEHPGDHQCTPCSNRHDAPGWTEQPSAVSQPFLRLTDDQDGCYIPTATTKRPPMDPVHILGIGSDEDASALRAALLARQQPPAAEPSKEAETVHACTEFDGWFDRNVCPNPCGAMHQRCDQCGAPIGGCANDNPAQEA